jgi:hypothetical protein
MAPAARVNPVIKDNAGWLGFLALDAAKVPAAPRSPFPPVAPYLKP